MTMPVVAVINRKGGSGKSTLATQLAGSLANRGLQVMLGDVDRQQSSLAWLRRRTAQPARCPAIAGSAFGANGVMRPPAGITHVVLDTPGGLQGYDLARIAMSADAILMPVSDSVFDRESALECHAELMTLPRVISGRCKVAVVGMRLDARTKGAARLEAWALEHGLPYVGALRESQVYTRCAEQGLSLFDVPPAKVEADLAQWRPITAWVDATWAAAEKLEATSKASIPVSAPSISPQARRRPQVRAPLPASKFAREQVRGQQVPAQRAAPVARGRAPAAFRALRLAAHGVPLARPRLTLPRASPRAPAGMLVAHERRSMTRMPPAPAIDCHVHVFDPARFPYADDAFYRPAGGEIATATQLGHVLDAYSVAQALIVAPNSGYGLDNRCLLHALAQGGGRYKGIALVRNDASRGELQDLQGQGVVGIAFNVALLGVDFYRDLGPLLERLRDLGLWAQMQVQHDELVPLRAMLEESGAPLLFDHCGRPDPARGIDQAGFGALLEMARNGRTAVKLSSLVKLSAQPFPHRDAWPFVRALVDAYTPHALVWASDWPFLRAPARIDYRPVRALVDELLPDEAARRAVLWDTPRRLFGFD